METQECMYLEPGKHGSVTLVDWALGEVLLNG